MPFIAAPVVLSDAVRSILLKFSKSRSLPVRQVQRSKIMLLAQDGLNNMQISKQVGLGQDSVSKWRNRLIKALPTLNQIAEKDPSHLEKELEVFLLDLPRPGQPQKYTDEQIIKILELACHNPTDYGYETSHWSLNQLVDVTVKEGIVDFISAKTISRFLKYGENPPTSRPLLVAFLRENRTSGILCRESE
jgi:transposase